MSLTLTFSGGSTLNFSQDQATDIGDYVGPFVHQNCYRQRAPATGDYRAAFVVFFRPDADGSRQEIVVEYGSEFNFRTHPPTTASGATPVHITAPYTATISGGGLASPVVITVPNHWWEARWRWHSAPRPFVRTLSDLVAMKALPPYSHSATKSGGPTPPAGVAWAGPMSVGNLTLNVEATGDRPEIGFITEQQAWTLLTGNANAAEAMMTDAEAFGTFPVWIRDAATGTFPNLETYPYLCSTYGKDAYDGSHQIPIPPDPTPSPANFFLLDGAHMPAVSYVPWLLTDDPWHLEGAMALTQSTLTIGNYGPVVYHLPGMAPYGQTRAFAWGVRDTMRMAAFAPASPPSWLLPQSAFQAYLADSLTFANKYLSASVSPCTTVFKLITNTGVFDSWQASFLGCVLGWAVWSGLFPAGWLDIANYAATPLIQMSNGTSGWDNRFPAIYSFCVYQGNMRASLTAAEFVNAYFDVPYSTETPTTWAQFWTDFVAWAGVPGHVIGWQDPSTWTPGQVPSWYAGWDYLSYCRAAMAACGLAGVTGAAGSQSYLQNQIQTYSGEFKPNYKWAIWTS